jgi:phosphatidylserine/phosphatidylglycerophosphate/cardiolipin synthase-like enzyme
MREMNKAKTTVLVQAYFFTSAKIAKALLKNHERVTKAQSISGAIPFATSCWVKKVQFEAKW